MFVIVMLENADWPHLSIFFKVKKQVYMSPCVNIDSMNSTV